MEFTQNSRLKQLPPYLFVDLDRRKKEAIARGVDIISLGIGDPDIPTPPHIVEAGRKALLNGKNHHYPLGSGLPRFRDAVATWFVQRFGVTIDPKTEINALLGSKEGIGHLMLGMLEPGDVVLVPEPGYPVYNAGTVFAGGEVHYLPLTEENGFFPDFTSIPEKISRKAKILFINYPNNPTAATATEDFFKKAIAYARKYNVLVAHDAAYSELYYGTPPASFLSIPGAREVGIEFHSLSKTYAMTGWRIGWVCGNAEAVRILGTVKDNFDSGVFDVVQEAGITALAGSQDCVAEMRDLYRRRRDLLVEGLISCGWTVRKPEATFYVWTRTPGGIRSQVCAGRLLDETGIVCTPGNGLGPSGEGYVRFALTVDERRIAQAVERIKRISW